MKGRGYWVVFCLSGFFWTQGQAQFCLMKNLCVRQIKLQQTEQGNEVLLNIHNSPISDRSFITVNSLDLKQTFAHYESSKRFLNASPTQPPDESAIYKPELLSDPAQARLNFLSPPLQEVLPFHKINKNCGGIEINGDFLPHVQLTDDPSC